MLELASILRDHRERLTEWVVAAVAPPLAAVAELVLWGVGLVFIAWVVLRVLEAVRYPPRNT